MEGFDQRPLPISLTGECSRVGAQEDCKNKTISVRVSVGSFEDASDSVALV